MKTRAAVLTKQKAPLEIWELTIPELKPGQVLVKVAYSGLCHSQLNEINGSKGEDKFLPHTLGHEGSGTVVAASHGVEKVKPGDRVVLSWIKGKGIDVPNTCYGHVNSGAISTFMTYAVISENRVVPIPEAMPLREAALLGCAIPTGAGIIKHEMKLKEGDSFVVFGAGGIGLSALIAARAAKAYPIIAVDMHETKLAQARACGATHVINASQSNPVATIQEMTQGHGVDFAMESAGKKAAMENAFRALKATGGLCVLAGNLPKGEQISLDPFELICGKKIVGTWGGNSDIDRDVAHYVESYLNQGMDFSGLITHEVSLDQINLLIKELEAGKVGRGLVCLL